MKFFKAVGSAFHSAYGAYIFYALNITAMMFFMCASHNYAWMAETYPLGIYFMPVFVAIETVCAAILCGFLFFSRKITNIASRIAHTVFCILSVVFFAYSAVLFLGLDKGFIPEEMKRGMPKFLYYLPHFLFGLAMPLIVLGIKRLFKNGQKTKLKAAVLSVTAVAAAAAVIAAGFLNSIKQTPAYAIKELPKLSATCEQAALSENFALPMLSLSDSSAEALLANPDRGLRMETYITLSPDGNPQSYPGNSEDPYEKMLGFIEKYDAEHPTVVQLYVYLSSYTDKPLDGAAFSQLNKMLELLKENNVRALLRFAYQTESRPDPEWFRVKGHLKQIADWFKENGQLAEDSIYAVQAGIVGYWGEGHSNFNFQDRYIGSAYNALFKAVPEDMFIQTRNIDLYNKVSGKFQSRHGAHDDYLIGEVNGPWSYSNGADMSGDSFKSSLNDGEMPWGVATYYDRPDGKPMDSIDVMAFFAQLKQYSMTTLSLEHNYRESGEEKIYSMARWKNQELSEQQLLEAGLPYHPSLLDDNGNINAFSYIQYHLGYLLSITSFEIDKAAGTVSFTIQNNGFAAPLNFNALTLVIGGSEYLVDGYNKYDLGSMQAVKYTVKLPDGFDGTEKIGIKISRKAGSNVCARFMNGGEFIDGAQFVN